MIFKNKKGLEKMVSVYWFVILILVAGAVVFMVSVFYGDPYDVREIEAGILANNVASCLSENGKLDSEITQKINNLEVIAEINLLEKCNLNFKTIDEEIQYYLKVNFLDFENKNPFPLEIIEGNVNLKENPSSSLFSSEKSFYTLMEIEDPENDEEKKKQEIIMKIFITINKETKNVG